MGRTGQPRNRLVISTVSALRCAARPQRKWNGNGASAPRELHHPKTARRRLTMSARHFCKAHAELFFSERVETFVERNGHGADRRNFSSNGTERQVSTGSRVSSTERPFLAPTWECRPVLHALLKRILDITFVCFNSTLLACRSLIVVMLWIKLVSPGPVFFPPGPGWATGDANMIL